MTSFDLGPALDSVLKAGPVACVLLLFIWYLIKQREKDQTAHAVVVKDLENRLAQKDQENQKLQGKIIEIVEKQSEITALVRDRLRQIVAALRLKSELTDTAGESRSSRP